MFLGLRLHKKYGIKSYSSILAIVNHRNWLDDSPPLIAERQETVNIIFTVFGLTRLEIELRSTVSVADALSTRPLIGELLSQQSTMRWHKR